MATKKTDDTIDIMTVDRGLITFCVVGTSPIILNRMSQKTGEVLLTGGGKKTAAEKAANMKHDPMREFRDSPHTASDKAAPTLVEHLATAFKKSMMGAAIDMPGAKKAQIGRLVRVEGERVAIYGVPKMFMATVRSADMNRTPDIRTRAIVPDWACKLTVSFIKPLIKEQSVANLLAAAGIMQGVGDWRTEKGSGNYGSFELVDASDPRFKAALKNGRKAQEAAMATPDFYGDETEYLYRRYLEIANQRGFKTNGKSEALTAQA